MLRSASAIRSAARLAASRSNRLTRRVYSTETEHKPGSIGKKLLWVSLLTGTAYSGATYFALKNEAFYDTYTNYIPGGEKILDTLEDWASDAQFKQFYDQLIEAKQKASAHTEQIRKYASQTSETAQDWYDYISTAIAQWTGEQEAPVAPGTGPTPSNTKRMRIKKATQQESLFANVIHSADAQPVPTFAKSKEESLNEFAKTVQGLVVMLNEAGLAGHAKRLVDFATRDIESLDKAFSLIKSEEIKAKEELEALNAELEKLEIKMQHHREQVGQKIKEAQDKASARVESRVGQIEAALAADKAELERQLEAIHTKELTSQRQHYLTELQNELKDKAVEIQAGYVAQVKQQVETERGGRLSKIEEVAEKQAQLEKLVCADAELLDDVRKAHQLVAAIDALKRAAMSGQQTRFELELEALKRLSAKTPFAKLGERQSDELIQLVASSIQHQVAQHGVTSLAALSERFETVAREARRASLIPEQDASMLSHLLSIILSSFMFAKKGLVPGEDVEARLARAEYYLNTEKDLESAAREMNQLTGWPKRLSLDWLEAARRHLEVKQALDILRSQASLLSMLQAN
ncbi:mitochondrial inner membrane protein Mitofilin [Gilbertella persicaria]|uniref:mitochondrial inner membrane protein Mitofilin n=1 Tax=Gilbertella persicaria TaxID=101096 RepID=UPI00221F1EB0|nr:mitochondrial inner membrane protein Mitofilin [Gilbertella persicaria]KAI8074349.1 mitochondrial inner membrane protein Mitofilin [Gilbertella persicaria]